MIFDERPTSVEYLWHSIHIVINVNETSISKSIRHAEWSEY